MLAVFISKAQDIHFSQFYVMPLNENPAKCGVMNGNYRFNVIYRSQWGSVTAPYVTDMMSGELSMTGGKRNRNDIVGLGFVSGSDKAGDSQLSNNIFSLTTSYTHSSGHLQKQLFSFGMQLGVVSANLNYSNLHFDQQYNGGALTENLHLNDSKYFDASIGMEYTKNFVRFNSINFGAAIFHVNNPVYSFMNNSSSKIYRKYAFNAGADIRLNKFYQLYPRAWFAMQGTNRELVAGMFARLSLNFGIGNKKDEGFYVGTFYRVGDAAITSFRIDIDHYSMTFSYDFNINKLSKVSNGQGGPEISMTWIGAIAGFKKKTFFCPRF